jgi:hypothetical protein
MSRPVKFSPLLFPVLFAVSLLMLVFTVATADVPALPRSITDNLPMPVVTDEPPTPTEPSTDPLNDNTGFENSSLAPWIVKDASGDKLRCSTEKPLAHTGNCAFQFKNTDPSGKLQKKIDFSQHALLTANDVELSLFAHTKDNAEGSAKVVVIFADNSKQKFSVDLVNASTYLPFTQAVTLTQANVIKAKLTLKGTNAEGKFYVDDVVLHFVEDVDSFSVLPLPAN